MAWLAALPSVAAAQFLDSPFARSDAPAVVTDFVAGREAAHDELEMQIEADLRLLSVFGGKGRLDRFTGGSKPPRPLPWRLYGRLGPLNFQQELEPQYGQGLRFSFRRTGPRLVGRVYIGIYRTFD